MTDTKDNQNKQSTGFQTEQEQFWAGEFGTDYIDRNRDEAIVAS